MNHIINKIKEAYMKLKIPILLIIFILSIYIISNHYYNIYKNNQINNEIREMYHTNTNNLEVSTNSDNTLIEDNIDSNILESHSLVEDTLFDFEGLLHINSDVIGWIKINNTNIDYPILKSIDNKYYLDRNIKKEYSPAGSLFMDYRNKGDLTDFNTIIYGHNMKDGSMFKDLIKYKNNDFYIENPIIEINTLTTFTKWEIFSAYVSDTSFNYIKTDFKDNKEYEDFLNKLKDKSMYDTGIIITKEDIILTLSTCSYEFYDARFTIHAILIK